jgi:pimeloyl-ACP methyl ester carboxylesterase
MRGLKRLGLGLLALLVFASVLPYLLPMSGRGLPPRKSPYLDGRFTEVCGLRWHFQRWQPADTVPARARVLLIHGFAGSTFSWRLTGPALAERGYQVIAVDLPPYGYSSRGAPDQPLAACVARIVSDEAGELPVIAVGHSMGASVAARTAAALGERAVGLVLVDGGLGGRSRPPGALAGLLQYPPFSRWAEVAAHYYMLRPERFAATLASAYGRAPSEAEVEGYRTPLLLAGTAPRVLSRGPAGEALDLTKLPSAQLILWGRRDTWVPPAAAARTAEALPGARLHWIDEAAHNPMETHPAEFMEALGGFLDGVVPPPQPPSGTSP